MCTVALIRIDYDFTLVKLASPVELNDHVAPACFPDETQNLEETFPPEMTCVVTGWGSIDRVGPRPQAGLRPALQHGAVREAGEPRLAH